MKLFIAGRHDLADVLAEVAGKARKRLLVCCFLITLPFFLSLLARKKSEGVDVSVIMAAEPENVNSVEFLRRNGVRVKLVRQAKGRLHAKFIVADKTALLSTFNYTHDGVNNNFEIAVLLGGKEADVLAEVFGELWSQV